MSVAQPLSLSIIREGRGISLQGIAETTKISSRFLEAIEAWRFDELPEGIFRTSYLKQYAECIGLDQMELLARYQESINAEQRSVPPARTKVFWWLHNCGLRLPFSR